MKSKNQHLNRTLNSLIDIFKKAVYPPDYNARNNPRPKAVKGEKLKEYERLENLRR